MFDLNENRTGLVLENDKRVVAFGKPKLVKYNTIYLLRCGHIHVDYHSESSYAVARHRVHCLRSKQGSQLPEDIVMKVPVVTPEVIQYFVKSNLSPTQIEKLNLGTGLM